MPQTVQCLSSCSATNRYGSDHSTSYPIRGVPQASTGALQAPDLSHIQFKFLEHPKCFPIIVLCRKLNQSRASQSAPGLPTQIVGHHILLLWMILKFKIVQLHILHPSPMLHIQVALRKYIPEALMIVKYLKSLAV